MRHCDPMKAFINNLTLVRERNGWTVAELAAHCDMKREEMSRLLNSTGDRVPNLKTCIDIAKALDFQLHELFDPNFKNLIATH